MSSSPLLRPSGTGVSIVARGGLRLGVALLIALPIGLALGQQARVLGPWWLELSRYLPYPVLLAPGVLALVLSANLGWRWVVASLVCLLTTLTLGMGMAWGRPDRGALPLRVMTWNIKAYKAALRADGFAELAREVARQSPELLLVQDNQGAIRAEESAAWPDGRPFGLEHAFIADQFVIASRHPLRDCGIERLDAARPQSAAARCTLDVGGVRLTVVTVHLDSPRAGLNATRRDGLEGVEDWQENVLDRLWQARLLAAQLKDAPRPLIVAGDLNAPEASQVVRTLKRLDLRDAFSSAMRGWGYTYGQKLRAGFSFLRIDHILVGPEIGVARCEVGGGGASDHRPVIADLWLRRDREDRATESIASRTPTADTSPP